MPIRCCIALLFAVISLPQASAAILQGIIESTTGSTHVRGMSGETVVGFETPSELLRPEFRSNPPNGAYVFPLPELREQIWVASPFNPGSGDMQLGEVFLPGLSVSQLSQIEFASQASFVAEIIRFTPTFVVTAAEIPTGQTGLYIIVVPEPSTLALGSFALLSLAALPRRK